MDDILARMMKDKGRSYGRAYAFQAYMQHFIATVRADAKAVNRIISGTVYAPREPSGDAEGRLGVGGQELHSRDSLN